MLLGGAWWVEGVMKDNVGAEVFWTGSWYILSGAGETCSGLEVGRDGFLESSLGCKSCSRPSRRAGSEEGRRAKGPGLAEMASWVELDLGRLFVSSSCEEYDDDSVIFKSVKMILHSTIQTYASRSLSSAPHSYQCTHYPK